MDRRRNREHVTDQKERRRDVDEQLERTPALRRVAAVGRRRAAPGEDAAERRGRPNENRCEPRFLKRAKQQCHAPRPEHHDAKPHEPCQRAHRQHRARPRGPLSRGVGVVRAHQPDEQHDGRDDTERDQRRPEDQVLVQGPRVGDAPDLRHQKSACETSGDGHREHERPGLATGVFPMRCPEAVDKAARDANEGHHGD